ncbi:hypothetical protein BaOVIS_020220 [Babesia ovis]|uniref:Uncharacterized protein n=1 Tax=Babesia ovis TaxID=5869 RepID=A0A9W5TDA7_BABOV|nr:hypothetical protein BaOVIS_020220 [Babesia ovis]
MSRIFIKQVPKLVRQHLPRVPALNANAVVEAMEDAAGMNEQDKHVEQFVTHCASRALALLPDLRVTGIIRALFAYKKADVDSKNFVEEVCKQKVAKFLLEECGTGGMYESFLDSCTANDILLLYKAFAVNNYFNLELYTLCMGLIATQIPHMTTADCNIFFQTHVKYISAYYERQFITVNGKVTMDRICSHPLATQITLRFLEQRTGTPEDIVLFSQWLVEMADTYGLSGELCDRMASFYLRLSQRPVIFNVDHIHRLIQSTCKVHASLSIAYRGAAVTLIESLLQEAERRSDVHTAKDAINTLYSLYDVKLWRFELLSGLLYTAVNNVDSKSKITVLQAFVDSLLANVKSLQTEHVDMLIPFTLELCPPAVASLRLHEIRDRLEERGRYLSK